MIKVGINLKLSNFQSLHCEAEIQLQKSETTSYVNLHYRQRETVSDLELYLSGFLSADEFQLTSLRFCKFNCRIVNFVLFSSKTNHHL